jgi:CheY-like chemotaxis protein
MSLHPLSPPRRLLIADDDLVTRKRLETVLSQEGYEVIHAATGREALAFLRTSPAPLIVLLNQSLSGTTGEEVLAALADQEPLVCQHAYVLASSSSPLVSRTQLTIGPRVIPIISKPFDLEELLDELAQAAQQLASRSTVPGSAGQALQLS